MEATMIKAVELLYLFLAVPTIVVSAGVVHMWGLAAIRSIKRTQIESVDMLIIGIVISFIGHMARKVYWSCVWGAAYLECDVADQLMLWGVFANIPFGEVTVILAGYCHLVSAEPYIDMGGRVNEQFNRHRINRFLIGGFVAGAVITLTLVFLRLWLVGSVF